MLEDAAHHPLGPAGNFWLDAEDPWQCLATCKEITKARASGDPEAYLCRLPAGHYSRICFQFNFS